MAAYTTSLRLVQPATGEYSGTWGTQVNNGLTALVDTSVAGTASIVMTAADYTLSTANGATDEARAAILNVTGTPGAARNIIVPALSKLYVVFNNTTGGFAQTVKTSAGSGISVPNGASMTLRCDGTNVVVAQNYFASLTLGAALPVASGGTGSTSTTYCSLTANVTGTLPAANGGTGQSSYAVGDLLFASTTTALSKLADVATGNALISGGVGVAPSYGKIGLTTHVSGTLPVANGGTNATATPTAGAVAYGTGTAYAFNTAGSSGQPLLSGGAGVPTFGTLGVGAGGTGATSLTANNVLLGNGTSALQVVAPGTNGNVLTSNGTTWVSQAATSGLSGQTDSATPFETSLGYQAGNANTGTDNTFVGYQSGLLNSTGYSNTAFGYNSLISNTTGAENTAIGSKALDANTIGRFNTAVGPNSLGSNTTGENNTAVGRSSLFGNSTGSRNTAFGSTSLASLVSTTDNVAVGYGAANAFTGNNSVAVGSDAAKSYSGANDFVAIGAFAFNAAVSGGLVESVGIGYNAGAAITSGQWNVFIGRSAAAVRTSGQDNVAVGYLANGGGAASTGNSNTGVGSRALRDITSGANNTALGSDAAPSLTTGSNNTIIGASAAPSSNTVSNEITLGNGSITAFRIPGLSITAGVKYVNVGVLTVATLPAAATAGAGARAFVSDANATTFASVVAGGGANNIPVYSDGTDWRIG